MKVKSSKRRWSPKDIESEFADSIILSVPWNQIAKAEIPPCNDIII